MQSQDFQTMHSQAIEYAQKMHRRSTDFNNKCTDTNKCENKTNQTNDFNPLFTNKAINSIFSANNQVKKKDNDISLILALILLLSSDGGGNVEVDRHVAVVD